MHNIHAHTHTDGFVGEVLVHTLEELVFVLPFLFLTYLLMEFLEHKAGKRMEGAVKRAGRVGPLWGSLLGIIPQCGFSAAASGLYAGRVITLGTLLAIFLSTSDEMLPLLIAGQLPVLSILKILGLKVLLAMAAGFAVDGVGRLLSRKKSLEPKHEHEHEHEHEAEHTHEHSHEHGHSDAFAIHELCKDDGCKCEDGIWLSSLKHTLKIGTFLLLVVFLLNTAVFFIGRESLASLFTSLPILGPLLSALIGLIPNCAASVIITQLYLEGVITAGCLFAGLLTGAGIGLLLLFRIHRDKRDALRVLALLYGIGAILGVFIDLLGIGTLL